MSMDLVDSEDISEQGIVEELRKRFFKDEIYSAIGPIVISLNPYKKLHALYSEGNAEKYKAIGSNTFDRELPPHVWTIAQNAFSLLSENRHRQAVIVSGESGAGKTEATKTCLQYLSMLTHNTSSGTTGIEDRVLATNPVLESFGNSKTARNNNSSRFGKWLEISFRNENEHLHIQWAKISQYLLEKSRVVHQAADERNYHIFYQLCSDPAQGMDKADTYKFLNQAGSVSIHGVSDADEFAETLKSMENLGFTSEQQNEVMVALKAILLLGNIEFENSAGVGIGKAMPSNSAPEFTVAPTVASVPLIKRVAELLGFAADTLQLSMLTKTMKVRGETTHIPLDVSSAQDARNALAKEIYGRLFVFIVKKCNSSLHDEEEGGSGSATTSGTGTGTEEPKTEDLSIGLLDVFGFENFKMNSFEQLCINYANEKLHQYFINYVIKKEMELYAIEIVKVEKVDVIDNQDLLELIEDKQKGIFKRLDEELKLTQKDDVFLRKVEADHNSKNPDRRFVKGIKMARSHFEIRHFAGAIRYDSKGFLEKNRDKLYDHLEELMLSSTKPLFLDMMTVPPEALPRSDSPSKRGQSPIRDGGGGSSSNSLTIASRFQLELQQLFKILSLSEPHFVKCIKPNANKSHMEFDARLVHNQLCYSGVIEALHVRRSGYPTRRDHQTFRRDYWMLTGMSLKRLDVSSDEKTRCIMVQEKLVLRDKLFAEIVVGEKSLVFMKPHILMELDKQRNTVLANAAVKVQSMARAVACICRFRVIVTATRRLEQCMNEGERKNSSNTEVIDQLKQSIEKCRYEVKHDYHMLNKADALLARLIDIRECLTNLQEFLDTLENPNKVSKYPDVLAEYQALQLLVKQTEIYNIDAPQIDAVKSKAKVLSERAECLLSLRSAVGNADEEEIEAALKKVSELSDNVGSFCELDEIQAKEVLSKIKADNKVYGKLLNLFEEFMTRHHENIAAAAAAVANVPTADDSFDESFASRVTSLESSVERLLLPYDAVAPSSPIVEQSFAVLRALLQLHSAWLNRAWSDAAELLAVVDLDTKTVVELNAGSYKPSRNVSRLEALVKDESSCMSEELSKNVLAPLLFEAVKEGAADPEAGYVDYGKVDIETLGAALEEACGYTWCDIEKSRPLFDRVALLLDARSCGLDEAWGDLLALCESVEVIKKRKKSDNNFRKKLKDLSFSAATEEDDDDEESAAAAGEEDDLTEEDRIELQKIADQIIDNYVADIEQRKFTLSARLIPQLPPYFRNICAAVDTELQLLYQDATVQHCVALAKSAQSIGRVEGETGEIRPASVSFTALLFTVSELQEMKANVAQEVGAASSSAAAIQVIDSLEASMQDLCKLRGLYAASQWAQLLELWENNQIGVLKIDLDSESISPNLRGLYSTIKEEVLLLLIDSINSIGIDEVTELLAQGGMKGDVGCQNLKELDYKSLAAATVKFDAYVEKLESCGFFSDLFIKMLEIGKNLSALRKAFVEEVSEAVKKEMLDGLLESAYGYAIPSEMELEMDIMGKEIAFSACFNQLKDSLYAESPVQYLVVKSQSSSTSTSGTFSTEASSSSSSVIQRIDSAEPSPVPVTRKKGTSFDAAADDVLDDVLTEENLTPNEEALDVSRLEAAVQSASALEEEFEEGSLPESFSYHVEAAVLISKIRKSVASGNWTAANSSYTDIKSKGLIALVPIIEEEMQSCGELINNFSVIATSRYAIKHNFPIGAVGMLDFQSMHLEPIDDALKTCESIAFTSERATALVVGLRTLSALRHAQKENDWVTVRAVVTKAVEDQVGTGFNAICKDELNRAKCELENFESLQALRKAIINEEVFSVDSMLDVENVEVKELQEAFSKAQEVKDSNKGAILRSVLTLVEELLKSRKVIKQRNWHVVESLLPVLKGSLERLQEIVEKADLVASQPLRSGSGKMSVLSTGATNSRQSVLSSGATNSRQSLLMPKGVSVMGSPVSPTPKTSILGGLMAAPNTSGKHTQWDTFAECFQSMKREIKSIEHHFAVIALEAKFNAALRSNGVTVESLTAPDKASLIKVDDLNAQLAVKAQMESSNLQLSNSLKTLSRAAHLIVTIRLSVIKDEWDSMTALLEEISTAIGVSHLQESNRAEIKVVRTEVENRWIIRTMTNALETGRLEGELGAVDLQSVSCEHLPSSIESSLSMKPQTEQALLLIRSGEAIFEVRKLICDHLDDVESIDWLSVSKKAKALLMDVKSKKFDVSLKPELQLMLSTAEDTMLCLSMSKAIREGAPRGVPGELDVSKVTTWQLDQASKLGPGVILQTKMAAALHNVCGVIKTLREAVVRTAATTAFAGATLAAAAQLSPKAKAAREESIEQAWATIESIMKYISDAKRSPSAAEDTGSREWDVCHDEIMLITKHMHIQEFKTSLTETIVDTSEVYSARNAVDIMYDDDGGEGEQQKQKQQQQQLNNNSSDGGMNGANPSPQKEKIVAQKARLHLNVSELEVIIKRGEEIEFDSEVLTHYLSCAKMLCVLRKTINEDKWDYLKELCSDKTVRKTLKVLPEAEMELAWVNCEARNHCAIEILSKALKWDVPLKSNSSDGDSDSTLSSNLKPREEVINAGTLAVAKARYHAQHNVQLKKHIEEATALKLTSVAAKQLLECCHNVLLLRESLHANDDDNIKRALGWFRENVHTCPPHIHREAQDAYVYHQNALLVKALREALASGKPSGKVGEMDLNKIETESIAELLEQAEEVQPRTQEVEDLIEAAQLAYSIRYALKCGDSATVQNVIDSLSDTEPFHLSIVDEIARARVETDNQILVTALTVALKSFDAAEAKTVDMSFLQSKSNDMAAVNFNVPQDGSSGAASDGHGRGHSILQTFSAGERRYSFANTSHSDVDVRTIDTASIEYALRLAEDSGVHSIAARRLHNTVHLIHQLRSLILEGDWIRVEELLAESEFEKGLVKGRYDKLAVKEIESIRSQLEMRAGIVELSTALKVDWAKCSNGIVDASHLTNERLALAIERTVACATKLMNRAKELAVETAKVVDAAHAAAMKTSGTGGASRKNSLSTGKPKVARFADDPEESSSSTAAAAAAVSSSTPPGPPLSAIQKQVMLLIDSAKIVLRIRDVLHAGDIVLAGSLAEEALCSTQHSAVLDELKMYSKEISVALSMQDVFAALRDGMCAGNIEWLDELITDAKRSTVSFINDLGLLRTLEKAEQVLKQLVACRNALQMLQTDFDVDNVKKTISQAESMHLDSPLIYQSKDRLRRLQTFEALLVFLDKRNNGLFEDSAQLLHVVVEESVRLRLSQHPRAQRARIILRMTRPARAATIVAQTALYGNDFIAATHTIKWKRAFLDMPSSIERYKIENFSHLRTPDEYGSRMNVLSEPLKKSMLVHSVTNLPTSLTRLSPPLAALAVWIFAHCIRGVELNVYTETAVIVRNLVQVGRRHPRMRDEILLQILKQLRPAAPVIPIKLEEDVIIKKKEPVMSKEMAASLRAFSKAKSKRERFGFHAEEGKPDPEEKVESPPRTPPEPEPVVTLEDRRLWRLMKVCLYYFAPSRQFENFLESFLIDQLKHTAGAGRLARTCIRLLHQSVFKYGYEQALREPKCTSVHEARLWLQEEEPGQEFFALIDCFVSKEDDELKEREKAKQKDAMSKKVKKDLLSAIIKHKQKEEGDDEEEYDWDEEPNMSFVEGSEYYKRWTELHDLKDVAFEDTDDSSNAVEAAVVRGSRVDWMNRFARFNGMINEAAALQGGDNNSSTHEVVATAGAAPADRFLICNKLSFVSRLSSAILAESDRMDRVDMEVFSLLLCGKQVANRTRIHREYTSDAELFHFKSAQDALHSAQRQQWLNKHIPLIEKSSELFFSQLKMSDLTTYAERFWDTHIEPLAKQSYYPVIDGSSYEVVDNRLFGASSAELMGDSAAFNGDPQNVGDDGNGNNIDSTLNSAEEEDSWANGTSNSMFGESMSGSSHQQLRSALGPPAAAGAAGAGAAGATATISAFINWEIYRELVLVGIRRQLEPRQRTTSLERKQSMGSELGDSIRSASK